MTQNPSIALATWEQVVTAFRDSLRLRVCDDQPAVDDSVRRQKLYQMREMNSVDPRRRMCASQWFNVVTALQDPPKRAATIEMVYGGLVQLAQVALKAAVGDGPTRQTAGLRVALQSLARSSGRSAQHGGAL